MIKRLILLLFVFSSVMLFSTEEVKAQDPEFTQFYAAPLYLNPAFAGSARCPRVTLNYRNQWPSIPRAFVTSAASYDQHVDAISGGIGIMVMTDKAGEANYNMTTVSGIYSYQLNVSRNFSIKTAIQATYVQRFLDWDKLNFGDEIDPRFGFVYQTLEQRTDNNKNYVDFSAGIIGFSSQVYGGFAANHLTEPDEAFIVQGSSPIPMKLTAHVGAMLPVAGSDVDDLDDGTFISPNAMYQQQDKFNTMNVGVYVLHSPLVGGLWYRGSFDDDSFLFSDSFIALVGLQKGIFKVGYSYDVTVSELSNVAAGSHEITMGLQFDCRPRKRRTRVIRCPQF
ncbi:MAG: type IX secretion system membrane protein PorP/SprF [Bacteroidia bacterium]|nr:type IX secretion system membrane protein PorP/SprF [Bacteroidia bacterium]NNC86028.1 type IX secretion system membrane protein PorP/SprF [Bacteroidia bacterium]NNM16111.1 type IX secretion system membrane protein PorP/SprF [Bacteroidia bacterium]